MVRTFICVLGGGWLCKTCLNLQSAHIYLRTETPFLCELSKVARWPSGSPAPAWVIHPVLCAGLGWLPAHGRERPEGMLPWASVLRQASCCSWRWPRQD